MISVKLLLLALMAGLFLLFVFLSWLFYLQAKERENLYDRIQAGTLSDYRTIAKDKPPPRGGNMITAGLKKAANNEGYKAGET